MLFLGLLCIFFATANTQEDAAEKCSVPIIYTELGCKAIYEDNPHCPTRFDCGLLSTRSSTQCYYKGKAYNVGERLEHDPENPCAIGCTCLGVRGRSIWGCAIVDCYSDMVSPPEDEVCYLEHSFDSCCAKRHCYPNGVDLKTLPGVFKCEYKGKTYLEGEYIETDNPCASCICKSGFNGKLDENFCIEVTCGIELHNSERIREGCVPIYYGDRCCPIQYRCPASDDSVIKSSDPKDTENKCTFGDLTLNVGDKLSAIDKCVNCVCSMPPFVTCIQTPTDEC